MPLTAVAAAASADAVVVAVGEKAYAEGLGDNPAPQLPPDQKALIAALQATGKPVIVVVIAGRPLGLGHGEIANGLLMAYQGSTEAGAAVAGVIFGAVDPSARLSVTWPSDAAAVGGDFQSGAPSPIGDQPKFLDQLPGTRFSDADFIHEPHPLTSRFLRGDVCVSLCDQPAAPFQRALHAQVDGPEAQPGGEWNR